MFSVWCLQSVVISVLFLVCGFSLLLSVYCSQSVVLILLPRKSQPALLNTQSVVLSQLSSVYCPPGSLSQPCWILSLVSSTVRETRWVPRGDGFRRGTWSSSHLKEGDLVFMSSEGGDLVFMSTEGGGPWAVFLFSAWGGTIVSGPNKACLDTI